MLSMVIPMILNRHYDLYISSCCDDGGIYHCTLDRNGEIKIAEKAEIKKPMYTVINGNKLYTVLRRPFDDSSHSGIMSFDIINGLLCHPSGIISTKGDIGCHLCVHNEEIYAANYMSGSIIRLPDLLVKHCGKSINTERQESAHAHCVMVTPDEKYILAADLGVDKIITYDTDLNYVCEVSARLGSGPRHLAFSKDGSYVFCVNEMASSVTMYQYTDGRLSFVDEKSTLFDNTKSENTAAAIKVSNGKVYASNRGDDSIAVFSYAETGLRLENVFGVYGKSPRDFEIIDNVLLSANERSDSVAIFDLVTKKHIGKLDIKNPVCVSYI